MSNIFNQIINKKTFYYHVVENDFCISFLDIHPLKKGHTLVVPKIEIDELFYLPKKYYNELMKLTYIIAQAIKKAIPCKRIGLVVLGMEIPHAHIHLIPLDKESDLNFKNQKLSFKHDEMQKIAKKISNFILKY